MVNVLITSTIKVKLINKNSYFITYLSVEVIQFSAIFDVMFEWPLNLVRPESHELQRWQWHFMTLHYTALHRHCITGITLAYTRQIVGTAWFQRMDRTSQYPPILTPPSPCSLPTLMVVSRYCPCSLILGISGQCSIKHVMRWKDKITCNKPRSNSGTVQGQLVRCTLSNGEFAHDVGQSDRTTVR